MWIKPKWTKLISPLYGLDTDARINALEAIRKREQIDHESFAGMIQQCPTGRRRHHLWIDGMLKFNEGISEPKERWTLLAMTRFANFVNPLGSPTINVEHFDKMSAFAPHTKEFTSLDDAVDYCLRIDQLQGVVLELEGAVAEVDEIVGSVVIENLRAIVPKLEELMNRLAASKSQSQGAWSANDQPEDLTKENRLNLIRRLLQERLETHLPAEYSQAQTASLSDDMLYCTPEASLVRIAERFVGGRQKQMNERVIIHLIHHEFKTALEATSDVVIPEIPEQIDLWGYARFFVDLQHGHGAPLTDAEIEHALRETFRFYKFTDLPTRAAGSNKYRVT